MQTEASFLSPPVWIKLATSLIPHFPAGRYRAIDWLCRLNTSPFIKQLPMSIGGYSFVCDLRDTISKQVCFTGIYEPQETALIREILKPCMTFIDVGANWGYFTLIAAGLVGTNGRVLSLEPDPRMFKRLKENVAYNQLSQVNALCVAAADSAGTLPLAGYDEDGGNFGVSRLVSDPPKSTKLFQVETIPLDDLLDSQQVDSVDLMKMDIEGAERLALAGLNCSLTERRIRRLLLELHPRELLEAGSSVETIVQILIDAGYTALTIDHSPATTRDMAYGRVNGVEQVLRPFTQGVVLDDWPHQLWLAPGVEAL